AVQFLTVLPIRAGDVSLAGSAIFFPLVGAALGASASGVYLLLARLLPTPLASILAILFLVLATGGLHEDGLADVADAFRAGRARSRERAGHGTLPQRNARGRSARRRARVSRRTLARAPTASRNRCHSLGRAILFPPQDRWSDRRLPWRHRSTRGVLLPADFR